ncbi:hypothetical protein V8C86DRAFT_3151509 [Haematococcus lacustris]
MDAESHPTMEMLGMLYAPVGAVLDLAVDCTGFTVVSLHEGRMRREVYLMGSRDGSGFSTLPPLTAQSDSITADTEGHIWLSQGMNVTRLTASGASTDSRFSVHTGIPLASTQVLAMQCVADNRFYYITKYECMGQTWATLDMYKVNDGSRDQLAQHVSHTHGFAVFPNVDDKGTKVLFISKSESLCQLDLGSREVRVLVVDFTHTSARLFSGPGPLAALLVPDPSQSPPTSSLYSCSEEGELQLLRSGLVVADNMLAVNKAGDALFFQPHQVKKELLNLVRLRSALPPRSIPASEEWKADISSVKHELSQS